MDLLGRLAQGAGRTFDYLTPGAGTSTLTDYGRTMVGDGTDYTNAPIGTPNVLGASTSAPMEGQMYYDNGTVYSFRNGQWVAGNGGVANTGGNNLNVSTGGGSSSTYDPQTAALYDNQIGTAQSALGLIGNQRQIGYDNIENSYTESQNKLGVDRGLAERDYNLKKDQTGQDYTNTRAGIRANAGNQFGSIQRLLGSKGAGRSSAAQILAPFAVGKEAASRFGQVQDQFGRNQQALDTNWGDTTRQFDEYGQDLNSQREQKRRELEQGINSNEAGLQDQIAQLTLSKANALGTPLQTALQSIAPQQSRIQELLSSIDNLGRNYQGAVQAKGQVKFAAPELAQYNYSQFSAPQLQGGGYNPQADYVSPLTSLLGKDKEKKI